MGHRDKEIRERHRRLAADRREHHRTATERSAVVTAAPDIQETRDELEAGKTPSADGSLELAANEAKIEKTEADARETLWSAYCSVALKFHRGRELPNFHDDLRNGLCPDVKIPELMNAAAEFVVQSGRLRPWKWSPAPTTEQLEDLPGWITQRLADEEVAKRRERRQRSLARELGKGDGRAKGSPTSSKGRNPEVRDAIQAAVDRYERGEETANDYQSFLNPRVMIHCTRDQCVQFARALECTNQTAPPAVVAAFSNWSRVRVQQNSVEKKREKEEQRKMAVREKEDRQLEGGAP
jgi:hypothetical protein